MQKQYLFMVLLGCRPAGRYTEQHDIFFGIAANLKELISQMVAFWPEAKGKIHIDAWRIVNKVDNFKVEVVEIENDVETDVERNGLFFINLGGYKKGEFDELHYKMLVVANQKAIAIKQAKETAFYKHVGFKGATSHIDDKFGIDVDDIFEIEDILPIAVKNKYRLKLVADNNLPDDELNLGYLPLTKIK